MSAPIVKWVGGKTRLLGELRSRMPAAFNRYYEPFAGGAALFFDVAPERAVLGDANADLINMYRAVALEVEAVIAHLKEHRRAHSERRYYETRQRWNSGETRTSAGRAADFLYLNKTCFNGLWRVNKAGAFNVPMGDYADPTILDVSGLRAASEVLRRAELRHGDYRETVRDAQAGDFVYFDPPYVPVSDTSSFTSYTVTAFGEDEQRQLAALARELVERGCSVMLSNSDMPIVRSLYPGMRQDRVRCGRTINSKASKRGDVDELVIVGVPHEQRRQDIMTVTNEVEIAALDRIDYRTPHRAPEPRRLPCPLTLEELAEANVEYTRAVRMRETLELEAKQEAARRKGLVEAAAGEERRLFKILETRSDEKEIQVQEYWAKRGGEGGEDVLVAVRLDRFRGAVDSLCYVGTRFPQPMDRQTLIKAGSAKSTSSGPTEEQLQRQAAAALASADPDGGEPLPFDDEEEDEEEDREVIAMPGAAEPETAPPAHKRSRKERASKTAAKATKSSDAKPAKAPKGKAKAK